MLTNCNQKKRIAPPAAVGGKKNKHFFSFSPQRRYEEIFGCYLRAIYLKKNFRTSRLHWHRSNNSRLRRLTFSRAIWLVFLSTWCLVLFWSRSYSIYFVHGQSIRSPFEAEYIATSTLHHHHRLCTNTRYVNMITM